MGVPITVNPIVLLDDVKGRLSVDPSDATEDSRLNGLIASVSHRLERYLDRGPLSIGTTTENYDYSPRSARIFLQRYPVITIDSIKIDVESDFMNATALTSSDYRVQAQQGVLILDSSKVSLTVNNPGVLDTDPMSLQVTYQAGVADDAAGMKVAVPDLYEAVLSWLKELWERRDRQTARVERHGEHGFTRMGELTMPGDVADALFPHKRVRFI